MKKLVLNRFNTLCRPNLKYVMIVHIHFFKADFFLLRFSKCLPSHPSPTFHFIDRHVEGFRLDLFPPDCSKLHMTEREGRSWGGLSSSGARLWTGVLNGPWPPCRRKV